MDDMSTAPVIGQRPRSGCRMAVNRSLCGREDSCSAIKVAALESKFLCICRQPSSHSSPVENALLCSVTGDYLHLAHPGITWLTCSLLLIGVVFSPQARALRDGPLMYSPPALANEGAEARRPATHVKPAHHSRFTIKRSPYIR